MDGRDFGPQRSVHGPPPPLLSGLAMDGHRVGTATAGRLPASGLPGPLPPGKYMAGLNLHPHPGFAHLPSSLYPSYLHLNHLEPPSSGSPLLSQLGQPNIFDTQKDGFYLPAPGAPGTLHSHAASSRTPGGSAAKGLTREAAGKERSGRGGSSGEPPPLFGKKEPRLREEVAGPRGVVDLTQEARTEGRQDRGPPRLAERLSPFLAEAKAKGAAPPAPPPPSRGLCGGPGDAGPPPALVGDAARQDESARLQRPRPCGSPPPRAPPAPSGPAGVFAAFREPGREHRVVAPTFVPSVEAFEERAGPIQIASQARDARTRERDVARPGVLQAPPGSPRTDPRPDRPEILREKNSVIRSLKRPPPPVPIPEAAPARGAPARASPVPKELPKPEGEPRTCDRGARGPGVHAAGAPGAARLLGLEPARPAAPTAPAVPEPKWKPLELGHLATAQMAALAAQHHHASRAGPAPGAEDDALAAAKKAYLDPGASLPRSPAACARPGAADLGEASAMQSLIKYSGSFARDAPALRPAGTGARKNPFGGLGTMKPEPAPAAAGAPRGAQTRAPHPGAPAPPTGRQLKRDPERPESAKAFGRDGPGAQGEAEVRHPPVGIAVAVARQKDSGGGGRLGPGLGDQERPLSLSSGKGHGRAEEGCVDERSRHREERLLGGRLDREQEKLLRESKELADLARLHPTSCAPNGLNPNLMVTGGPTLAGSGRWPADPAAHLASHPWLPRSGGSSMWLAGHPYGLGPPPLHQGVSPAFPPSLGGSLPSAYQFVRDPQSGQLVVIPSDHLPHFAELMERAAVPPLWPALYPPGRAPLHHAQQLQLFSQQHFLRQQEFLYLQQQAAQALELQRSAQLVERLKTQEHRADMEEKVAKRSLEASAKAGLAASGSGLLPRKPPGLGAGSTGTYGKAVSPPPSPHISSVAALKAKVIQKLEDVVSKPPPYAYPATPSSHPSSPPPASPPPNAGLPRKEEAPENVVEKKDLELEKEAPSPFQSLFSEIPPRYPFQALPPHYGRPHPFLLQPTAAADADGLAPDVPLPADGPEHLALSPEDKPIRLSPKIPEPLAEGHEEPPLAPCEVKAEVEDEDQGPPELPPMTSPLALPIPDSMAAISPAGGCRSSLLEVQVLRTAPEPAEDPELVDGVEAQVEMQDRTVEMQDRTEALELGTLSPEPLVETKEEPVEVPLDVPADGSVGEAGPEESLAQLALSQSQPSLELPVGEEQCSDLEAPEAVPGPGRPCYLEETSSGHEDPLAGMNALAAAAELPQARPLPSLASGVQAVEKLDTTQNLALEQSFLQGITLLSEIAELELERRSQEAGGAELGLPVRPSLESLLAASSHMLREVLDSPFVDPLKNLRLPRELNPNKKYSWMQRKEERMYAMKSSLEDMDALELDFRMRLAEVQRQYKEKQRELVKLQRRRDSGDRHEDSHRSLARRGPGRPRKRTHTPSALSPPCKRGRSHSSSGKLSKSLLTADDYELGAGIRKRHKGSEEEQDVLMVMGKARGRNQSWEEHEASSDFLSQLKIKKKKMASDQEQLASKLDKALSLTKQDKLKSPFKFSDPSGGKSKSSGGCSRFLSPYDSLLGKDRKALAKGLGLSLKSSRDGKHKRAAKARKMEVGFKVRGQPKSAHSPFASEVSSYSYNTDSEEEDDFLKDEWSAQGPSSSKLTSSLLCGMVAKSSKPVAGPKLTKRGLAAPRTLKTKAGAGRKQPFCLLLREAEARSSFSDSSENSFDQGY
ncbi:trinucleotide repeat-containing gene 18 protein isoform 4-T4 [Thomomys bottae]